MNRDEFTAAVDEAFERMIAPLAKFPRALAVRPLADGKWSLKELAAHFIVWDQVAVRALEACYRGERFDWNGYSKWDELNAQAIAECQADPHSRTAAEWRITHTALMEGLRRVPDERLLESDQIPAWLISKVLDHYRHHAVQVEAWLETLRRDDKPGLTELDVLR